jgi:hypothetical protein
VLGLSDEEFYALTPKQFWYLMDAQHAQTEHTELLFGQVCATICNWGYMRPKELLNPSQFMPSHCERKPEVTDRDRNDLVADQFRNVFSGLNEHITHHKPAWVNRVPATHVKSETP